MDEELKSLKRYLYVLCEKIAGIQSIVRAGDDGAFLKEYKLYFLLFVHRIRDYNKDDQTIGKITRLDLIDKINGLIDKQKSSVKNEKLTSTLLFLEAKRDIIATEKRLLLSPTLSDFQEKNKEELDKIKDAKLIVEEAKKENKKIEDGYDDIINSLISHLGNITGKEIKSLEYLNVYLYNTNKKDVNGKFDVEEKIDEVKKKIAGDDLTEYYSFINTMIHKINPASNPSDVKKYVNKYFDIAKGKVTDEDLKIRKVFMIYLINNIIYYHIILNNDDSCDKKIRFIFYNRYIKFSKIAMVAPQKNGQYTVLNKDIIKRFKEQSDLFDLTNNIIRYEHNYLSECEDYNESIKKKGGTEFKNETALAKYNELSTKYGKAYTEYKKAYAEYEIDTQNKSKGAVKDAENKKRTTAENNLRNAVYKFNEELFCCFSKYIELNFKNRINSITEGHAISTYVKSINDYNESCKVCDIKYAVGNHIKKLNTLKYQIESVMTEQITLLLIAHGKDTSKDTMNDTINMVIEIEKNIQEIYDELLYLSINTTEVNKIQYLERKYEKTGDSSIMTHNQMMREIIKKLNEVNYYNDTKALSTIYDTLKSIVNEIGIPNLTFETLKKCCLYITFMDKSAFIDRDDADISSIIYDKAFEDIGKLIDVYKQTHQNTSELTDIQSEFVDYSKKINGYIALVEKIKDVEKEARYEKKRILELLVEARMKANEAYTLTTETDGKIKKIVEDANQKIIYAETYLEEEEAAFVRYNSRSDRGDIEFDRDSIRTNRLTQREECSKNIATIKNKISELNKLISDIFALATDAKKKAYIYKDDADEIISTNIADIKLRLNEAIRIAQKAIDENSKELPLLDLTKLLYDISPPILMNELTTNITKKEAEERKREAEQRKREAEQRKREADDSVSVAIDVGKAIVVAQDTQEADKMKGEADDSVRVAIDVGKAIVDTQDTQEADERKREADDSVGVAIDVGNAIPTTVQVKLPSPPPIQTAIGDELELKDAVEEIIPAYVKRPDIIDEDVVKGRYLYPGLFKEVKEGDLKTIREYHAEQVRNKFPKKRGVLAEMDAEIDKFNYPQMGGSGSSGDMINRLNRFENNINNPIEAFEIKFEDRLVFIIATFFIRYVSMSIIQRGIDSNMAKTFYEGFIYYGVIYILLFWFIVLFINIDNNYTIDYIDDNNLAIYIRSIFYYFYMGTNGISRLVIHTLLILVIIIIPILLNIKNGKAKDAKDDDEDEVKLLSLEERTKLSKALSLFTLFIWILTSIIASKF